MIYKYSYGLVITTLGVQVPKKRTPYTRSARGLSNSTKETVTYQFHSFAARRAEVCVPQVGGFSKYELLTKHTYIYVYIYMYRYIYIYVYIYIYIYCFLPQVSRGGFSVYGLSFFHHVLVSKYEVGVFSLCVRACRYVFLGTCFEARWPSPATHRIYALWVCRNTGGSSQHGDFPELWVQILGFILRLTSGAP